ncbi:MAG TPA: M56 family metallopeptidase, partial [Thermoanaerobaculia bacterium]|nr:M56 family metallopeptidase [Thermoanaerobaculia bacterium]
MNAPILVADLTAWALQTALLLAVGLLLPALFRLRAPRVCLAYWQGLLLMVLLLPLLQPQAGMAAFAEEIAVAGPWLGQIAGSGTGTAEEWTWQQALLAAIAAGALGRLIWLGVGLRALRLYRREAVPLLLEPEVSELARLLSPRARLAVSPRVTGPVTFGWRDPVVLFPTDFLELPVETRRGIVCHELLHVRRRDWLFALFEEGVRALFWFHPAVWMLLSRIALSREQVVDREAVRLTGSRRAYLEALRAVACQTWQTAVPGLPFFHRGHLLERVAQLCKEVPMSRSRIAT